MKLGTAYIEHIRQQPDYFVVEVFTNYRWCDPSVCADLPSANEHVEWLRKQGVTQSIRILQRTTRDRLVSADEVEPKQQPKPITAMTDTEFVKIVQARADGKRVEMRCLLANEWREMLTGHTWDLQHYTYRIASDSFEEWWNSLEQVAPFYRRLKCGSVVEIAALAEIWSAALASRPAIATFDDWWNSLEPWGSGDSARQVRSRSGVWYSVSKESTKAVYDSIIKGPTP